MWFALPAGRFPQPETSMPQNALILVARLLVAYFFLSAAAGTLGDISGSAAYFAGLGFPASTLVAVGTGLFELVGGLALLVGFQLRVAAVCLSLFCLAAGFIGHLGQGGDDQAMALMHAQALMKDIAIAAGLLALAAAGPGAWSIDARTASG